MHHPEVATAFWQLQRGRSFGMGAPVRGVAFKDGSNRKVKWRRVEGEMTIDVVVAAGLTEVVEQ